MSKYQYTPLELQEIRDRKEKSCTGCGVPKPLGEFGKNPASIDGRTAQCLECQRKRQGIIRMARKIVYYV